MSKIIKYYQRPTLKQHNIFLTGLNLDFFDCAFLKAISLWFEKRRRKRKQRIFHKIWISSKPSRLRLWSEIWVLREKFHKEEFIINKKNKIPASVFDLRNTNVISPALINDSSLCRHIQIIGASGSGKTVLIKSLFLSKCSSWRWLFRCTWKR